MSVCSMGSVVAMRLETLRYHILHCIDKETRHVLVVLLSVGMLFRVVAADICAQAI